MELKEFITETITQIVEGVTEAQKKTKETGCLINPEGFLAGEKIKQGFNNTYRSVQKIKMNIVLNVSEEEGRNSGIKVVKFLDAGIANEKNKQNSQMTSVEFDIPIALPVMEESK